MIRSKERMINRLERQGNNLLKAVVHCLVLEPRIKLNSETILPLALYLFFKENFELFNTISGNLKPDFARSIILQFVCLS